MTLSDGMTINLPANTFSSATTVQVDRFDSSAAPSAQGQFQLLSKVYSIDAGGESLNGPVTLTFPYDPSEIIPPQQATDLVVAFYAGGVWSSLPTTVDTTLHTVTVSTTHFSLWAVAFAVVNTPTPTDTPTPSSSITPSPSASAARTSTATGTISPTVTATPYVGTVLAPGDLAFVGFATSGSPDGFRLRALDERGGWHGGQHHRQGLGQHHERLRHREQR